MPGEYEWLKTGWEKVKGPSRNNSVRELDQNKEKKIKIKIQ